MTRGPGPQRTGAPGSRSELAVVALLLLASAAAAAFVAVYVVSANTQLLGATLASALGLLAAAAILVATRLLPEVEEVEERPALADDEAQQRLEALLREGETGISRKRLLAVAAGTAGASLGAALIVPAASLGPRVGDELTDSPWRRGRRLVDERGKPIAARDIQVGGFLTAFPEGADRRELGSSVVVVRVEELELALPRERAGWGPQGILAFSKICPHAGCAIALFRYPSFAPTAPGPALVCPCHYSTFDVLRGGTRIFGPAGRALPQLPLAIDGDGLLACDGSLSGHVGPAWWGVRRS